MSFKITITETRMVNKITGKEWRVVRKEEKDSILSRSDDQKVFVEDVYDYTPEIKKLLPETREILIQVVDDLDLAAVIKAVNGL